MTDLNYTVSGSGQPLILIHSGGTDSRDWKFIAPTLSENYKVITYDIRGAGKSPIPLQPVNHIKDLKNLIDHLDIKNPILVGHSLGGQIATDFSILYPDLVTKLIVIAPGLTGYDYEENFKQMNQRMWKAVPNADEMLSIMLSSNEAYAVSIGMESAHKDLIREVHLDNIKKSLKWKNFEINWPIENSAERLKEINIPTLYIHPEQDKTDLQKIKKHYEQVPNITFKDIPNSDHSLTWTHSNAINQLILEFLKS